MSVRAAVAEKAPAPASKFVKPAGTGLGFYTGKEDGYLYCDNMRIDDIRAKVCRMQLMRAAHIRVHR